MRYVISSALQFLAQNTLVAGARMPLFIAHLGPLLLLIFIQFFTTEAADSFHSPFTARPLRIRLVNYERQFLPPKHVATPDEAERLVAPHAHNMPHHQVNHFWFLYY